MRSVALEDFAARPACRLMSLAGLSRGEVEIVSRMPEDFVMLSKRELIRGAGEPVEHLFMLMEGWASASVTLGNGARHIIKVHLPGDMMGGPSLPFAKSVQTLSALTPVIVGRIPLSKIAMLFADHPRLAALLFIASQAERVELMDQLASNGQLESRQRMAAFLVTLHSRLEHAGLDGWPMFDVPLTQEEIGDVLGLTGVHVNRMLHALEGEGLIRRETKRVEVLDLRKLKAIAAMPARTIERNASWLPA